MRIALLRFSHKLAISYSSLLTASGPIAAITALGKNGLQADAVCDEHCRRALF
jgi:hypothetical protein